jgi:hypothetical protein
MSLLPATESNGFGRIAFFGGGGSGKSVTATLLAMALSIERHNRAPIALVDPEGVEKFLKPLCDAESVPLLVESGRSFVEMQAALKSAEEAGCCAFVVDHYDGIHRELVEAQKAVLNLQGRRLPYQHREDLTRLWEQWVRTFRGSQLHTIFNGRLSWDWGDDSDESGDPIFVKLGTKMRGDADAGYEPDLLIELEAIQDLSTRHKKTRSKTGTTIHWAHVLKDRKMILNGLHFSWKDLNAYQAGQYQGIWKAFAPHFGLHAETHRGGTEGADPTRLHRSSAELFAPISGESRFAEDARRRTIACEELQATLSILYPTQTAEDKRLKLLITESLFQSRSWTAIEHKDPLALENAVQILHRFEGSIPANKIRDEAEVIATIEQAKDAIREAVF